MTKDIVNCSGKEPRTLYTYSKRYFDDKNCELISMLNARRKKNQKTVITEILIFVMQRAKNTVHLHLSLFEGKKYCTLILRGVILMTKIGDLSMLNAKKNQKQNQINKIPLVTVFELFSRSTLT